MAMAGQVALRFPVVGWLLRDAIYGRPEAKYYFLANCIARGGPRRRRLRLRLRHLAGARRRLGALALLIYMTAADSFSKANRRALAAEKKRRPAL